MEGQFSRYDLTSGSGSAVITLDGSAFDVVGKESGQLLLVVARKCVVRRTTVHFSLTSEYKGIYSGSSSPSSFDSEIRNARVARLPVGLCAENFSFVIAGLDPR